MSSWLAVWILTVAGDQFRSLRLTRGGCPHDVTVRYLLKVTMDQWSCAVVGCNSVICHQAFVFANLLDVSSDGGGVMPTPNCRTCHDDDLHQVIEPFCGGFSGWSHASRFLHGLEFPIFTCLALDVDPECALAFHKTFGGTLMALCPLVQLSLPGKGTCALVMSLHFFNLSLISDRFIALTCLALHLIVVILVLTQ